MKKLSDTYNELGIAFTFPTTWSEHSIHDQVREAGLDNARSDEQLKTFGQVRDLMKRLHDQNVSTSYAAHAVWKVISNGSGITANQEALAKDIARSLHEMSILRHGMFTPVDFEAIVANRIRSFFHSQNIEDTHGAKRS